MITFATACPSQHRAIINRREPMAKPKSFASWTPEKQEEWREKRRVHDRRYAAANKEKKAENSRKLYEANKERFAEHHRKYYESNKEKIAERARRAKG